MIPEVAMARPRFQQGHVFEDGASWYVQYREYRDGAKPAKTAARLGPAGGPERIGKREAERLAAAIMAKVNERARKPESAMTLSGFVEQVFQPRHVQHLTTDGQRHYRYCLGRIERHLGARRLCDLGVREVSQWIGELEREGLGRQTVQHYRNALSAIFRLAIGLGIYERANPAAAIRLAGPAARRRTTYDAREIRAILAELSSPYHEMVVLSIATSLHAAELARLCRRDVNLTPDQVTVEGVPVPAYSLLVREGKTEARRRICPITREIADALAQLLTCSPRQDEDAPLFQNRKGGGRAVNIHNTYARIFAPISKRLGIPISWHAFRRAHSSLAAGLADVSLDDRVRQMGHADARMTLYYNVEAVERRRAIPAGIMAAIREDRDA